MHNPVAPPPSAKAQRPGLAYALLLAVWISGTTLALHTALWFVQQVDLLSGGEAWVRLWPVATLAQVALVLLPALLGWRAAVEPRYRAIFQTWALGAAFALCLLPTRLVGFGADQAAAGLQIGGALLYLGLLALLRRRGGGGRAAASPGSVSVAVTGGLLLAVPWVAWGALGSPLDTALNGLAALLFGLAAGWTIADHLWPLFSDGARAANQLLLAGVAIATLLALMAGAFGVNGQQIILLALLPGLGWFVGWLAAGIRADEIASPGMAVLMALAVAAPLLFVDPDELNILLNLGSRDVGVYTFFATLIGMTLALLLSVLAILRAGRRPRLHPALGAAAVGGIVALYVFVGQPGWYGDRLFVVLANQPDVIVATVMEDPVARRAFVYDTLVHHANATQAELRRGLDRLPGDYTPYYLVNALEVDGGPLLRWWLMRRPEVDRVLDSPRLRPLPRPPATARGFEEAPTSTLWTLRLIGAPAVWARFDVVGQGIVIGQNDSGVDGAHPELRDAYRGVQPDGPPGDDYNWLDPWNGTPSPVDSGGHGTHTLATAVGESVGVAPGATWIACVNLPRNLGNPARYLDCLQFLLAPYPRTGDALVDGRPELGAHVLNNSWGCPTLEGCDPTALHTAVRSLRAAGVFVVASAGNDGDACSTIAQPLALYDEVFTVGATDANSVLADYSSRGPVTVDGSGRTKPDIVAPGSNVLSAFPDGTYATAEGTSMAGPHVVGVVALLWSANPSLIGDIDATERILTETAKPYRHEALGVPTCGASDQRPDSAVGFGLVDAYAAVQRALSEAQP